MAHMPTYENPTNISVADLLARIEALEANPSGGDVPSERSMTAGFGLEGGGDLSANRTFRLKSSDVGYIAAKDPTYGAVGDGVTDDRAAIIAAVAVAAPLNARVYLPKGTYWVGSKIGTLPSNTRLFGDGAKLKWDSTSYRLMEFASTVSDLEFDGIHFEGNVGENEPDDGNIQDALAFLSGNTDVTIRNCTFSWCRPTAYGGNSFMHVGRLLVDGCKFLNCTSVLNAPSNSTITKSFFINDEPIPGTNHAIYVFGEAQNVVITGNHFVNASGNAIKFNSAASRWGHKHLGVIANNHFTGGVLDCIWLGGDGSSDAVITGMSITGNTFHNTNGKAVHAHNISDLAIVGNSATWDWEHPGTASSITAGFYISSAVAQSNLSPARNNVVVGNTLRQLHPFVGAITFTAAPQDGDTFTVGSVTYTWRTSPSVTNDVLVRSNAGDAAEEAMHTLRGNRAYATMNTVLRGQQDAFSETATALTANPVLVVTSDATFTLSESSTATSVTTAVTDKRVVASAVHANEAENVSIRGNTFENFNWITLEKCVEPVVENNTLCDVIISDRRGVRPTLGPNKITWNRARTVPRAGQATTQQVQSSSAWPVIRGNGLTRSQHYTCPEMLGVSGVVPVSNGKAYADLYYGVETLDVPAAFAFKWSDGDTVQVTTPAPATHTFTFKRTTPGANEFNSTATLRALIDGIGGGGVFVTSLVPTTFLSDSIWIRVTYDTVDTAGNDCWMRVTSRSRTCGQLLLDSGDSVDPTRSRFRGGNASVNSTKTFIWTPLANPGVIPIVQGVDATSRALVPYVDQADIIPAVGFYASHGAAGGAGAEKFNWWLPS